MKLDLTQEERIEYRLDLLEQLHAADGLEMSPSMLNSGQVRIPRFRHSSTDDVMRELRAMDELGWLKLGRARLNAAVEMATLREAGRVALVDAHRIS